MLLMVVRSVLDLLQSSLRWLLRSVKNTLWKAFVVLFIFMTLLWLSAFMYGTFYYSYMPLVSVSKPVHFQFSSCDSESSLCSYPTANVSFEHHELLMRGQRYRVLLRLEVPESRVNEKIGMFMVTIKLYDRDFRVVTSSSRATMLRYRSPLLHTLHTLFFSALYLSGMDEQKQTLDIELYTQYVDDAINPAMGCLVELHNKKVQFYSAHLNVHAYFTGLRFVMYHWPMLSAIVGTGSNLATLMALALLSWYRYAQNAKPAAIAAGDGPDEPLTLDERRHMIRARLDQEKLDDQARLDPTEIQGDEPTPTEPPDRGSRTPPEHEDVSINVTEPTVDQSPPLGYDDTPDEPDETSVVTLGGQDSPSERVESHVRQRLPVMTEE